MPRKKKETGTEPTEIPIEPSTGEAVKAELTDSDDAVEMIDEVEVIAVDAEGELVEEQTNGIIETLKEELAQAQKKADEYLDGWQRAQADFANYKKRIAREQAQNQQNATANAIQRSLDIFDDLDRALKNRPQSGEAAGWAEGIELIYRKLQAYLDAEGVEMIEAEGAPFDPTLHEAISQEDNPDFDSGMVIGVVQQGYRLGERVLRAARVRVAR